MFQIYPLSLVKKWSFNWQGRDYRRGGGQFFFNSGHLVTIFTPVLCQTPGSCVFAPGHILSHWSENIRSKVKNFTNIGDTLILFYIFVKLIHNHVIRQFYVRMKCYVFHNNRINQFFPYLNLRLAELRGHKFIHVTFSFCLFGVWWISKQGFFGIEL